MAISHRYHTDRAKLALELTMRDALAGLEELASLGVAWFDAGCLEILSIEPAPAVACPPVAAPRSGASATILNFPEPQRRAG